MRGAVNQALALGAMLLVALGCGVEGPARFQERSAVRQEVAADCAAEDVLVPVDHGYWADPDFEGLVRGYVDFAVVNYAYEKPLYVTVHVTRENGVQEHARYPLQYRRAHHDGREIWGTDGIRLYPQSVHHGALATVGITFHAQVDLDGQGPRELCLSRHRYGLADPGTQVAPQLGAPAAQGDNPRVGYPAADISLAAAASAAHGLELPGVDVRFAPYEDPEDTLLDEIDRVIARQQADGAGYHYLHLSLFDLNDRRLADRLIAAHRAGVEVLLLTDGRHAEPWRSWETEYPRVQAAGIPVLGIYRPGGNTASNHTKIAVFDGQVASTGSMNWDERAMEHNCENLVLLRSPHLAHTYGSILRQIAGMPVPHRVQDPDSRVNVYYSQSADIPSLLHHELTRAQTSVTLAMFNLQHLTFHRDGRELDVLDALVGAAQRGVEVTVVLERNIADEGEYFGTVTPGTLVDEWLADQGVTVIKVHTNHGGDRYAAMHHKFAVIDEVTTLTGAYNWYPGSQVSDDDLLVLRDAATARRYLAEVANLRFHHDPTFDAEAAPSTAVTFDVRQPRTAYGDTVCVVGDLPRLGGWDPAGCVPLSGEGWPRWSATVDIPTGVRFEYKYLVQRVDGTVTWESGGNRAHTALVWDGEVTLEDAFR